MSVIDIRGLSFAYDEQLVLENINLTVKQQDFLAIIGPNGGGKSTLLQTILGMHEIKKGNIKIFGQDISKNLAKIGYVPQNTNINTNFPIKVIEVVLMGHIQEYEKNPTDKNWLKRYFHIGYDKDEISCAKRALRQVGMERFAYQKIGTLSGGQRQRVMIARALCSMPSVLLLDEPTASIDTDGQKQIYELLKKLNKTITIIVVSHDISVIVGYASKVAHINKTLNYHDISQAARPNIDGEHFCEVEMLQLLISKHQKGCEC